MSPAADTSGFRNFLLALLGSNIFALIVVGIYEYLSLRGVINVRAAWIVLVFVWALGVAEIVLSEIVWGRLLKHRIRIGIGAAFVLALLLIAFDRAVDRLTGPTPPSAVSLAPPTNPLAIRSASWRSAACHYIAASDRGKTQQYYSMFHNLGILRAISI